MSFIFRFVTNPLMPLIEAYTVPKVVKVISVWNDCVVLRFSEFIAICEHLYSENMAKSS